LKYSTFFILIFQFLSTFSFSQNRPISPKWKLVDTTFKTLAVFEADSFTTLGNEVLRYQNGKKQIVYPKSIGEFYEDINSLDSTHYRIKQDLKWGLMDSLGRVLVSCVYDSISAKGKYILVKLNGKLGLLDSFGTVIIKTEYDYLKVADSSGRIYFSICKQAGYCKIGFADTVQSQEFDSLTEIQPNVLLGWKNGKTMLLDQYLNKCSNKSFRDVWSYSSCAVYAFDDDSLYSYKTDSSQWISQKQKVLWRINDTLLLTRTSDTLLSVYHLKKDTTFCFIADTAWKHPNLPTSLITRRGQYLGFASVKGILLTNYKRKLRLIGNYENGFLPVISKQYFGYIDTNGYLLISTQYDSVKTSSEGQASIKLRGRWGFVDSKDKIVVQPYYQQVGFFINGNAPVWYQGLSTLVDKKGNELFPPVFKQIYPTKNGNWITSNGHLYGFLLSDGKEIYNPSFSKVEETESGFFIVQQYGKAGVLSNKLEFSFPFSEKEIRKIKGSLLFAVKE